MSPSRKSLAMFPLSNVVIINVILTVLSPLPIPYCLFQLVSLCWISCPFHRLIFIKMLASCSYFYWLLHSPLCHLQCSHILFPMNSAIFTSLYSLTATFCSSWLHSVSSSWVDMFCLQTFLYIIPSTWDELPVFSLFYGIQWHWEKNLLNLRSLNNKGNLSEQQYLSVNILPAPTSNGPSQDFSSSLFMKS